MNIWTNYSHSSEVNEVYKKMLVNLLSKIFIETFTLVAAKIQEKRYT